MILIVGLGNPGPKYEGTRHNMGFETIARLSALWSIPVKERGFHALTGKGMVGEEKVMLALPQTYMNESGQCVGELMRCMSLPSSRLLVIYDDIDLPCGRLRLRKSGSAGTHNGMKSVIAHLGYMDFARLRVGVGRPAPGEDLADYVLGRPAPEEKKLLLPALDAARDVVDVFVKVGVERAMLAANTAIEP